MKLNLYKHLKLSNVRGFHASSASFIKVGDQIPSVELHHNSPTTPVNSLEHFKKFKKAVLIGIPGAFTPVCSSKHLPGYIEQYESLKSKGVEEIACVSVNDSFVLKAYQDSLGAENKVTILADPSAEFIKKLSLDFEVAALGGTRSKRFAMVLENGKVKAIEVEPDNTGLTITDPKSIEKYL